jgi:hypothetical protein
MFYYIAETYYSLHHLRTSSMKYLRPILATFITITAVSIGFAQAGGISNQKSASGQVVGPQKSSPAYAEVLVRRTELEADLESLLVEYTEDYPKVKQTRFELDLISKESDRLLAVKPAEVAKLTEALGKLIVRKVELQGELWVFQQQLGDAHPDVKRAKRKVEIFERAIKEILG